MGPILIFDKSFLESLTVDESVWLDNFFLTNIVPTFYVETLADLEKEGKDGKVSRTPEQLVEELAKKTPVMETCPNVFYERLVVGNLLGEPITMDTRPIISGGEYKVTPDGKVGINFKQFPEAAAQERWKEHKFLDIERDIAKDWRETLSNITLDTFIEVAKSVLPQNIHFSSIENVKKFADGYVKGRYNQLIHIAFSLLGIPEKARKPILKRWHDTRPRPFDEFAPYAAYILKINLFFYLCVDKSFLAASHKGKQTNIVDLSYLYYLPFCMVFASNDSLHIRIAQLFMEQGQTFVIGQDLKEDLKKLNEYYLQYADEIKKIGTFRFASYPPTEVDTLVGHLRDKHLKSWRENAKKHKEKLNQPMEQDKKLLEELKKIQDEKTAYTGPRIPSDKVDSMQLTRKVPVQRGSWRILPEGIENANKGNIDHE